MRLRALSSADVPALGRLCTRCDESHRAWAGPDIPVTPVVEQEATWHVRLVRVGAWTLGAQEDDGRLVAACAFATAREEHDQGPLLRRLAHVSAVFVDPDHWGRGIARTLLEHAEAAMLERGYERAQLRTLEGSPAERLYASAGWSRTEEREPYPPMGLMTIKYVKALGPRA